jgi:PhoH-like ATPase
MIVLDTSVLIHDPECIKSFDDDTEVVIPIFVVMELDVLKDGTRKDKINVARQARQASSSILKYIESGRVTIESASEKLDIRSLDQASSFRYVDLLILKTVIALREKNPDKKVKLLSKDVNLRILCESEGVSSEDYISEIHSFDELYRGMREIKPCHDLANMLTRSYYEGSVRVTDEIFDRHSFIENEYVTCKINAKDHLFIYRDGALSVVEKDFALKVKPRNPEQRACLDLLLDPEIQLVALVGKAGTGKTFLSLAAALAQTHSYQKILLSKPVVDVGQGVGFLPGSLKEKLEPWMQSFFDNLDQIDPLWDADSYGEDSQASYLEKNRIEIQPIHSIRGRSLKGAFMIIDEVQNLSAHEVKSIITRAAEGTKVILLGDPYQIDSPYLDEKSNGLTHVIEKMKDKSIFGTLMLHKSERSSLSDIAADLL